MLHPALLVAPSRIAGLGVFATAPLAEGDIVWREEARDVRRVHIDVIRTWSPERRARFRRYSYQISGEWHIGRDDGAVTDPGDYINHACDPTAWWIDDATLATRRAVAVGEEITYDYCTSETHEFFSLECACGTPLCRRIVTGQDYRANVSLPQRYGPHVMRHVLATLDRAGR